MKAGMSDVLLFTSSLSYFFFSNCPLYRLFGMSSLNILHMIVRSRRLCLVYDLLLYSETACSQSGDHNI